MEGGGTPDEIRAFIALIEDVQRALPAGPSSFLIIHHENRAGQVSGAWEGVPDLLVHVHGQGHGRLRVFWQKARWSSALHATGLNLTWAEDEGFAVEEKPELDDEAIAEQILAAIAAEPGIGWTRVEEQTPGIGRQAAAGGPRPAARGPGRSSTSSRTRRASWSLSTTARSADRRVSTSADDPTIRHLRPEPGRRRAADCGRLGVKGQLLICGLRPAL